MINRKNLMLFLLVFSLINVSNAQNNDSLTLTDKENPSLLNNESKDVRYAHILLPGGTHFCEGNIGKGLTYSIGEVGLIASGIIFDNELKEKNESEFYNFPLMLGQQLYTIDKGEYYIKHFSKFANDKGFAYDNVSINEMLTAPFDFKEIKKPLVLSCIGFGIIDAILSYSIGNKNINDIRSVYAYSNEFNPKLGSTLYTGTAGLISYGAGVSEEMLVRGVFLPAIDYRYGKTTGLISTSLLFSALHVPTYLKIKDPLQLAYTVAEITSAGFVLGKNAQNNDYNLKTVIAAHTWFNFTVMMTSWILNPKENPLGFNVSFRL